MVKGGTNGIPASSGKTTGKGKPAAGTVYPTDLLPRLEKLQKATSSKPLKKQLELLLNDGEYSPGFLNNALMDIYRIHASAEAYSLLYELNYRNFFIVIFGKAKHYSNHLDPRDILQDVFLSIYRYPHKFRSDKEYSFRNWSYSIIRNTILKHLKLKKPAEISSEILTEIIEDKKAYTPLSSLANKESMQRFKKFYLFYLMLYLNIFNSYLAEREKRSLLLVEVEGKRYREASEALGIKLENFKMVVCRARKKIHRRLNQVLGSAGS